MLNKIDYRLPVIVALIPEDIPSIRRFITLITIFYQFISVCLGSSGDMRSSLALAEETPHLVRRGSNPLERFLLRRANKMSKDQPDQDYCLLLAYELLYLWNALGACLKHSHASIQIGKDIQLVSWNANNYEFACYCQLGLHKPDWWGHSLRIFACQQL